MAKRAASRAKKSPLKKRIGRPATHPTPVGLSLLPEALAALDRFAKREGLSRAMAARWIIEAWVGGEIK
jgi:hypothetical protein